MQNKNRGILVYIVIAAIIIFVMMTWMPALTGNKDTPKYSEVMANFDNYEVSWYTFDIGTGELEYELKSNPSEKITYDVPNVSLFLNETENYREEYNQKNPNSPVQQDFFKIKDTSWLITVLPTVLILVMGIAIFVFMMKQTSGGGKFNSFGKTDFSGKNKEGKKATFKDVAGADEEKQELEEIVDFLKNSKKYDDIGARIPKGVLLLGPPGTGKTLLARAVAGEAGCPFFPISGSDFVEMFVGVGASRVRDLFDKAKKSAPAIIFIDEIDAVGRHRGAGLGGGHDEREQTLNQLLVEMDGFVGNESVIVMAATNRRDILDPALLRPGRFDRQIFVGLPDVKGREEILKVHTRNKPLGPDISLKTIAQTTVGFTGADLENLVNEASLLAARKDRKAIMQDDIEEATIKVIAGPEKKSKKVLEKEKRLTAYHESGHAICTFNCETQDKVHQVSIIPRGGAGGYTLSLPENDKSYVSKTEMEEDIVVLLGGRVAEQLIINDISTGASNDIQRATNTARNMVTKYGFSEKLGPMVYGSEHGEVFLGRDYANSNSYSEKVASEIDSEMRTIIETGYKRAEDILNANMDKLHFVSKYLMQFEKIDGVTFEKIMKNEIGEEIFEVEKNETPEETETTEITETTPETE
ncbi:MAG: ATP-dependent zinc metalloprotease FtsH [Oscillospiraceae bacterium]|jgi:cell division protease FtsH|nr:ATP-dependent zinc metalloprotease FtsH [Oscillospiraceae bacterium]